MSASWRSSLGAGFESAVFGPFVIAGNLPRGELDRWYTDTVRSAVDAICREYMDCQITDPVSILLFADEGSYRHFASVHSGRLPASIYGYYKPASRTVVINLTAGGGTLVHELTHALIDFDYPEAPIWLNEGIASMHEECRIERRDNQFALIPLDNWRLPILQDAVRTGDLRSMATLIESNFQGVDEAACYAQARYVCLYLRDLGLLDDIYCALRDNPADDSGGLTSIERVLRNGGFEGMPDFELQFRRWVMQRGARRTAIPETHPSQASPPSTSP